MKMRIFMKTPYWQITVETPRYGRGESILGFNGASKASK